MGEQVSLVLVLAFWVLLTAFVIWLLVNNIRTGMTGVSRSWPPRTLYRDKEPVRYWFTVTVHAGFAAALVFIFFYALYKLNSAV